MGIIDFHTHLLPGIDDGSQSVRESIELLRMLSGQKVTTVAATPHFNADRRSANEFIEYRAASFETLKDGIPEGAPEILLGAEVAYYDGISRMKELPSLCLEGTRLLLLEMPMQKWTGYMTSELLHLSCSGEFTVVLAHVERYLRQLNGDLLLQLLDNGALMQCNASFFTDRFLRRKAFRMLSEGVIHFIGSDCHGVDHRPPMIGSAVSAIEKKFGTDFVSAFFNYCNGLLHN